MPRSLSALLLPMAFAAQVSPADSFGSPWAPGTVVWQAVGDTVVTNLLRDQGTFPLKTCLIGDRVFTIDQRGSTLTALPDLPGEQAPVSATDLPGGDRVVLGRHPRCGSTLYRITGGGEIAWELPVVPGTVRPSPDGTWIVPDGSHGGHGITVRDGVHLVHETGDLRCLPVGLCKSSLFIDPSHVISLRVSDYRRVYNAGVPAAAPTYLQCHDLEGMLRWSRHVGDYYFPRSMIVDGDRILLVYGDMAPRGHETEPSRMRSVAEVLSSQGEHLLRHEFPAAVQGVRATLSASTGRAVFALESYFRDTKEGAFDLHVIDISNGEIVWERSLWRPRPDARLSGFYEIASDAHTGAIAVTTVGQAEGDDVVLFLFDGLGQLLWKDTYGGRDRELRFISEGRFLLHCLRGDPGSARLVAVGL